MKKIGLLILKLIGLKIDYDDKGDKHIYRKVTVLGGGTLRTRLHEPFYVRIYSFKKKQG